MRTLYLGLEPPPQFSQLDSHRSQDYRATVSAALDAVAQDALVLPPDQRLVLARKLLESVDLEPDPGVEAAWDAEIAQRVARFKAGESKAIPAGEVFARLRQIAPDLRALFWISFPERRRKSSVSLATTRCDCEGACSLRSVRSLRGSGIRIRGDWFP